MITVFRHRMIRCSQNGNWINVIDWTCTITNDNLEILSSWSHQRAFLCRLLNLETLFVTKNIRTGLLPWSDKVSRTSPLYKLILPLKTIQKVPMISHKIPKISCFMVYKGISLIPRRRYPTSLAIGRSAVSFLGSLYRIRVVGSKKYIQSD